MPQGTQAALDMPMTERSNEDPAPDARRRRWNASERARVTALAITRAGADSSSLYSSENHNHGATEKALRQESYFVKLMEDHPDIGDRILSGALTHPHHEWTPSTHFGFCGQSCPCCRECEHEFVGGCEYCANTAELGVANRACKTAVDNFYFIRFRIRKTGDSGSSARLIRELLA